MFKNNKFCLDETISMKKTVTFLFICLFALFLTACSGESDEINEAGASKKATNGTTLYLKLVNNGDALVRNLDQNETVRVIATLYSPDDEVIEGAVINFTTDLGTLAKENALTNSSGRAIVDLASGVLPKAGEVTASTMIDGAELNVSFGFAVGGTVEGDPNLPSNPTPDTPVSKSNDGSISFVSAAPQQLTLKSTGGAGLSELSTVTFRLLGTDGLPIANQTVDFSINNPIGGIMIEPLSAITGFDGLVSTVVHTGTVPTSVRVTATTTITDGTVNNIVSTQSDMLAIGVGTPDQNSISLSLSNHAPEAWEYDGEEVTVTAHLGDHFNNFVPDGTTVYFTAEGGVIEPSCETENSACSVKWLSAKPRPSDHRVTILATTLGSESFQDTDSDGLYSPVDGEPFHDINRNGIYDEPFVDENGNNIFDEPYVVAANGRYDPGEAFVDSLNGVYDFGEPFVDQGNGIYDPGEQFTDQSVPFNGTYDLGEPFVDIGNGVWDIGETFTDQLNGVYDFGETFTDATNYKLGSIFIDYNANGVYDGDKINPAGETTFTDSNNGNGIYDGSGTMPAGELAQIVDKNSNGLFDGPGFADLGEPYLDANENFARDVDEHYVDTNNNGQFDATGDGKFNGIHCKAGEEICSENKTLRIRDSEVLVMAGSDAHFVVKASTPETPEYVYYSSIAGINFNAPDIAVDVRGTTASFTIYFGDSADQVLPEGTKVSISSDEGKLSGVPSGELPNNRIKALPRGGAVSISELMVNGLNSFTFNLSDEAAEEKSSVLVISFTTPKGRETSRAINIKI